MLQIVRLKFLPLLCMKFLCSLCVAPMKALKACRKMDSLFKFTAGHGLLIHCLEMELYMTVLKGSAGSGLQVLNSDQSSCQNCFMWESHRCSERWIVLYWYMRRASLSTFKNDTKRKIHLMYNCICEHNCKWLNLSYNTTHAQSLIVGFQETCMCPLLRNGGWKPSKALPKSW